MVQRSSLAIMSSLGQTVASIRRAITIGSNVVIGGGSVVVKDVPDNSVAVGNPCRVVRRITDADKAKSGQVEV